jgi:hypothetical protein
MDGRDRHGSGEGQIGDGVMGVESLDQCCCKSNLEEERWRAAWACLHLHLAAHAIGSVVAVLGAGLRMRPLLWP